MTALISALPSPPSRQDPTNFASKGDALLGALPTFVTEANAMSTEFNTLYSNAMAAGLASAATNATNAANSATAAAASATSANSSFLSIDKKWLGAKSANPTVDNQGAALATGAAYFNTTAGETRVWNGSAWVSASVIGGTVASLNVTGNVTLGDASTDTVLISGYAGIGGSLNNQNALRITSVGVSGISAYTAIYASVTAPSTATLSLASFTSSPQTAAASFTIGYVAGLDAGDVILGAGSTITSQHGVYVRDQTKGVNNYGVTSGVSAGTNKWNIYASGTAPNFFAGNAGFGAIGSRSGRIEVLGRVDTSGIQSQSQNYVLQVANASNNTYLGITHDTICSISANLILGTVNAERFRLTSGGNNLLGTSTEGNARHRVEVGSQTYLYEGLNAGTAVCRILANGNLVNTNNSYGAISDIKLKDVVGSKPSTWEKTKAYNWVEYYLKTDIEQKHKLLGLVAQEAELVSPGLVFQNPDLEEVDVVEEVTREEPVTELQTVEQTTTEPQLINGKWTEVTVTKTVEQQVQLYDEFPLFDEAGDPVMEKVDDEWVQKMHRVPRTQTVTESVTRKEMQPTGTFTKGVKYSVVAMEYFRAFQESQQRVEAAESIIQNLVTRVSALESA